MQRNVTNSLYPAVYNTATQSSAKPLVGARRDHPAKGRLRTDRRGFAGRGGVIATGRLAVSLLRRHLSVDLERRRYRTPHSGTRRGGSRWSIWYVLGSPPSFHRRSVTRTRRAGPRSASDPIHRRPAGGSRPSARPLHGKRSSPVGSHEGGVLARSHRSSSFLLARAHYSSPLLEPIMVMGQAGRS